MTTARGKFVWHELMTTDMAAAERFYGNVIGWSARDAGMPHMAYTILSAAEVPVGGIMNLPEEAAAMGPSWIGYIFVDDVDAAAAEVTRRGGTVYREPEDIPGVGRFAIIADPQGAVSALFKDAGGMPAPPAGDTPGRDGWHELHAKDGAAAFPFYEGLFGWTKADAMDMGPMGVYQIFAVEGQSIGGMMTSPAAVQQGPFWLHYFNVEAIDAAGRRVTDGGGTILNGPLEVPGGQWIVQCRDPQGAAFALVAPGR